MISVLADPDVLKLLVTGFEPVFGRAMFSPGIIARYALFSSEKIDEAETRRCSFAAKVEDETVEAAAIWLQGLKYRIRNRLKLVSPKALRCSEARRSMRARTTENASPGPFLYSEEP
jgi:hypothetical protein